MQATEVGLLAWRLLQPSAKLGSELSRGLIGSIVVLNVLRQLADIGGLPA